MSRFVDIDLTGLPPPSVVEALDFETILATWIDDMVARMATLNVAYDVETLESDPAKKIEEAGSFRELLVRSRINDAAQAVMAALALGSDLDQLAAYYGVQRLVVTPATDDAPAVLETDAALRRRMQLAPEAFAAAGPEGAYRFHALTVDGTIKDVQVLAPAPGQVHVLPLIGSGDGTPGNDLLERVRARLLESDIKPLTDMLTVRAPTIVNYVVTASLVVAEGPDPEVVRKASEDNAKNYVASRHLIGLPVRISALFAALHVAGVEQVTLSSPTADVVPAEDAAAFATSVTVSVMP
jgi:phage-related baseplate assembly protein